MMRKELLKEVLAEQRRRIERLKEEYLVTREKIGEVRSFAGTRHSIVVTGIRRCGKSVLLAEIISSLFEKYYYVNFEDERLAAFGLEDFTRLYEACIELFGECRTFFLDEVQNVVGWEKWVRRMYDDGFKFFITGSNARLLSRELATSLTGRKLQVELFPFSFREFLEFRKFGLKRMDDYITERRAAIISRLSEYLRDGGFPEYLKDRKIEILQEYFNDIIQRDIVERYRLKSGRELKGLASYLLTNTANPATYNGLKKATGELSINTIIRYVEYLEDAYLIFTVPFFSYSLKRQAASPFKVYAIDTGLRNAIGFRFSRDAGRIYETAVAIELKRRKLEVYYWKDAKQREVDFVIRDRAKISELVQVCHEISDVEVKNREISALLSASRELRCNNLRIITDEAEGEEKVGGKIIKLTPLWKWLLKGS